MIDKLVDPQLFYHLAILTGGTRILPIDIAEPVVCDTGLVSLNFAPLISYFVRSIIKGALFHGKGHSLALSDFS